MQPHAREMRSLTFENSATIWSRLIVHPRFLYCINETENETNVTMILSRLTSCLQHHCIILFFYFYTDHTVCSSIQNPKVVKHQGQSDPLNGSLNCFSSNSRIPRKQWNVTLDQCSFIDQRTRFPAGKSDRPEPHSALLRLIR